MRHRTTRIFVSGTLLLMLGDAASLSAQNKNTEKQAQEESYEYYRKWLEEDAFYIITPEEESVFEKLTTVDERDQFIEQFWLRRDPDTRTAENEFKEEHYRRIAYANERFHSGEPGWKTDRGEMYIKFGPPDGLESYPNGGPYSRRMSEGGGRTTVYPFERWRYNYIEGVGNNIEIEFVDPSRTGEYRIALSPQDKDALLYVQTLGAGDTEGEMMGIEDRWLRITRDYGLGIQSRSGHYAIHPDDFPFERLTRLGELQKAPQNVKFRDLKTEVTALISYNQLPFRVYHTFVRLNAGQFFVPITLEIDNKELHYQTQADGSYRATVQVYGTVTGLGGKIWSEFDHELVNAASAGDLKDERSRFSVFQRMLQLPAGRYRIDIFLKDPSAERLGVFQKGLVLDKLDPETLSLSPIVLADLIQPETLDNESYDQFTMGSLKVVPNVPRAFGKNDLLNIYLQAYNVQIDQSTLEPDLTIRYFLMKGKELVKLLPDLEGRTIRYVSPQRVVLAMGFRLDQLDPGNYRAMVWIKDNLSGQEVQNTTDFEITG